MGIQCKPKTGLLEVMKSQSGSKAPEKTIQKSHEVVEGGKGPFPKEAKLQKGAKQARVAQKLADKGGDSQVGVPA